MINNNKTLVYDDACPLCVWYTGAFVKTGLLEKDGRIAFSTVSPDLLKKLDWQRSRNEIPYYDPDAGKVYYGIDALLEILGQRMRCIKTIGYSKPIHWLLQKLYKLVSFNRKVVVAHNTVPGTIDCTPSFSVRYRFFFLTIFLLMNTLLLIPLQSSVFRFIPGYQHSLASMQFVHWLLVCCNCLLALSMKKANALEYLGQVNMLAIITLLLLSPLAFILPYWHSGYFLYTYLLLVSIIVIKEYFRRMHYAGILEKRWIVCANIIGITGIMVWMLAL